MEGTEPTPARIPPTARPADGVLVTEADGELVLLEPEAGTYFALDHVGLEIWRALELDPSVSAAVTTIQGNYPDVEPGRIEADVHDLVRKLETARLLDVAGG
jgi:uncharacterized lipoprotein NlpE involved in copper resistance